MSLSTIPKGVRKSVLARDAGRCRYCRLQQIGQAAVFHINHIDPRSKGGSTALSAGAARRMRGGGAPSAVKPSKGIIPMGADGWHALIQVIEKTGTESCP